MARPLISGYLMEPAALPEVPALINLHKKLSIALVLVFRDTEDARGHLKRFAIDNP